MRRSRPTVTLALLAGLSLAAIASGQGEARRAPPLPADPSRWVGEPTGWDDLRGRVALVFVWTFG